MRYIIIDARTQRRVSALRFESQMDGVDQIRTWKLYGNRNYNPWLAVACEDYNVAEEVNGL